jgi:ParB/RepB/Spo0J family partition protein
MKKELKSGATRLADLSHGRTDVLTIDPNIIVVEEGFNYRNFNLPQNKEHVQELKASIKVNGVLNPLWVRFDTETKMPVLVAGESRLRAVKELLAEGLEIKGVPCIQKKGNAEEILVQSLQENTGKPPSKWEVGAAYQRLVNFGWTVEMIAERMGQTKRYVEEALELKDAPSHVKKLLSEAAVTPSHYLATFRKHGDKATMILETQVKQAKEVAEKKAAEKKAKQKAGKKGGRPVKEDKPVTVKRAKKSNGVYVKDTVLKLVQSALKAAAKSGDVDVSMPAESALEALSAALKAKE